MTGRRHLDICNIVMQLETLTPSLGLGAYAQLDQGKSP